LKLNQGKNLRLLQYFAKKCADRGLIKVVFIASDGKANNFMDQDSAESRKAELEIGDASENIVVEYITKKGIDEITAEKIYQFSGGRFNIFTEFVVKYQGNQSFESICDFFIDKQRENFKKVLSHQNKTLPKDIEEICKKIIASTNISYDEFSKIVPNQDRENEILSLNVFVYHKSKKTVEFQNQPMKIYVTNFLQQVELERHK